MILSNIASQERPNFRGVELTCEEDADLRLFGKPSTRVDRRMGVVLVSGEVGADLEPIRDKAKRLASYVEVY